MNNPCSHRIRRPVLVKVKISYNTNDRLIGQLRSLDNFGCDSVDLLWIPYIRRVWWRQRGREFRYGLGEAFQLFAEEVELLVAVRVALYTVSDT